MNQPQMKSKKIKFTFSEEAAPFMLEALGYALDKEDYIINPETNERVLDVFHNEEIHVKELGGFTKKGIIKGDLESIMDLVDIEDDRESSN